MVQRQPLIRLIVPIRARIAAEFACRAFEDLVKCVPAVYVVDLSPMAHFSVGMLVVGVGL